MSCENMPSRTWRMKESLYGKDLYGIKARSSAQLKIQELREEIDAKKSSNGVVKESEPLEVITDIPTQQPSVVYEAPALSSSSK